MRRMDLQFSRKLACSLIKNIILSNYQIIILDKMRFIEYNKSNDVKVDLYYDKT